MNAENSVVVLHFYAPTNAKTAAPRLAAALFAYCGHCVADALDAGYPSHATGPLVTVTAGASSGDDPAARMGNPQ